MLQYPQQRETLSEPSVFDRDQPPHRNLIHLPAAREEAMESLTFQVNGIDTPIHFYYESFKC